MINKIKNNAHHIWILIFFAIATILLALQYYATGIINIVPGLMVDERLYINILSVWETDGLQIMYVSLTENKTLPFLYLLKLFGANPVYTRALNLIFIGLTTYLMYKLSNGNKMALLYPFIPIFLNCMWLTVEIMEVFFILLGLAYFKGKYMGIAVGLACLVRPYAFIYMLFLNKRNLMYTISIGLACCVFLYMHDVLWIYMIRMFEYGTSAGRHRDIIRDYYALAVMIPIMFAGYKNVKYSKYAFASMIGFVVQLFGHYFLVPYSFFFLAYLTMGEYNKSKVPNDNKKDIENKRIIDKNINDIGRL